MKAISILVVDDSHTDRRLIAGLLRNGIDCHIEQCENGRQALRWVRLLPPQLVIADLIMPEMDGLTLIRQMRKRHPEIPVILMTAYGNETIAVEALEAGAASYVPKAQQAERLADTVARVLARAAAEQERRSLESHLNELYCSYTLENNLVQLAAVVDQMHQLMAGVGLGDAIERIRACVALEEALLNALYHGNLEISRDELSGARMDARGTTLCRLITDRRSRPPCRDRTIEFQAHVSAESARFVIRDQGAGFGQQTIAQERLADYFECGHGLGLMLMHAMMDQVRFNQAGNEVSLVKFATRRVPQQLFETAMPQPDVAVS